MANNVPAPAAPIPAFVADTLVADVQAQSMAPLVPLVNAVARVVAGPLPPAPTRMKGEKSIVRADKF